MKFLVEKKKVVLHMMCMLLMLCLIVPPVAVQASEIDGAGTYEIRAKLSCYVNAMGGVEFGEPLMTGAVLNVREDGSESITIYLTKSSVTIYSVTCDTFLDADPGNTEEGAEIPNGTIGYYDAEGRLVTDGVSYTFSEDTALNPANEEVHYVDSITFPIGSRQDTYALTLYVNSNVMGVQFGSNYAATLTVNWDDGTEEIITDTEPVETAPEAEEMDGLSIYRAETKKTETEEAVVITQTTRQDIPWTWVIVAVLLILGGIGLVIAAGQRKDDGNA